MEFTDDSVMTSKDGRESFRNVENAGMRRETEASFSSFQPAPLLPTPLKEEEEVVVGGEMMTCLALRTADDSTSSAFSILH